MATWKSRGLRGQGLEEMLNFVNDIYLQRGLALIQKIPTPITPIETDKRNRHITLAYFDKKSTVDYIGVVQGIPVCFDAKECAYDRFSLANIHEHQIDFMKSFEEQKGISFLIIYFTQRDEVYYISYKQLRKYWDRMLLGGRKSFTYEEVDKEFRILRNKEVYIHYLEQLQKDLSARE